MSEEKQYLDLVRDVLENGDLERGRNGDTLAVFGRMMRFSLKDGKMPILTTKHVAWKTCFRELMWFVRGRTDNKELQEQGVHIWDANATREFLDSRGLTEYPEGILGPIYGYQWRNFGAPYNDLRFSSSCAFGAEFGKTPASKGRQSSRQSRDAGLPSVLRNPATAPQITPLRGDESKISTSLLAAQRESGFSSSSQANNSDAWGMTAPVDLADPPLRVDQLQQIIDSLLDEKQRYSRRLIMTAWNPAQIEQMALPPCHVLAQFSVKGNRLSCALYQRSGDVGLGVPFNIASYCFLTHLLAHHCGLEAHEFVHFLGDAHVYVEHETGLREQLTREPLAFPRIRIVSKKERIDDYDLEDLEFLEEYRHHPKIVLPLVA